MADPEASGPGWQAAYNNGLSPAAGGAPAVAPGPPPGPNLDKNSNFGANTTPSAVNLLLQSQDQANNATAAASQDTATATEDRLTQQGDLLSQQGYNQEAQAYGQAATIANTNAGIAIASGAVQQQQTIRSVAKILSSQAATLGGNGFGAAGSGSIYLMADSAQQGALEGQMEGEQSQVNALGFEQQAAAAKAEGIAAGTAGTNAGIAAQSEGVAATEADTEAGLQTSFGAQALTNAQNWLSSLTAQGYTQQDTPPPGQATTGGGARFTVLDPFAQATKGNPNAVDPLTGLPNNDPTFGID